jgi:protein-disulfide isomerase
MRRLVPLLFLCVGLLAGGLVAAIALRPTPGLDEAEVRAIVSEAMQAAPTPAAGLDRPAVETIVAEALANRPAPPPQSTAPGHIDAATIDPLIEDYLLGNPKILQRASAALSTQLKTEQRAATAAALAELRPAIYDEPGHIVLGNPEGDVTLVEMFDYNCSFCRAALPDLAALLDGDPNLRVILKEFPILSQGSADAARIAVLVNRSKPADYWQFHQQLFTSRGEVTKETALKAAADLGLNPIQLELRMNEPTVTAVIERSFDIANRLKVDGTPTYIIGNEVIPSAVGLDQLKTRIANMRACGETECPAPESVAGSG